LPPKTQEFLITTCPLRIFLRLYLKDGLNQPNMDEQQLRNLLDKYLTGTLGEEERDHLSKLLQRPEYLSLLERIMYEEFEHRRFEGEGHDRVLSLIQENIHNAIHHNRKTSVLQIRRWVAAAAAVIGISIGMYLVLKPKPEVSTETAIQEKQDILPGGNKAVLTLDNGSTIILDSAHNGLVAQQNGSNIIKTDSGKLTYSKTENNLIEIRYNTLTTPRGGKFQITLADGTKVWLNAASSIKYPTAFTGRERRVVITGEAYFEVVHNAKQPFIVSVNNIEVTDIGTHFNINAYENENQVSTTLFEGSISLKSGKYATLLKPGEQAELGSDGRINILKQEQLDQVIAWKNGYFNFRNADMPTVMRQLERWYDIDVHYEGQIPERRFQGELPRNMTLQEVLQVLREVKINYKINGKMLIIYN
jgi:transmembrane sensor